VLTWAAAIVLATGAVAGLEVYWRARGHRPSVVDNMQLWAVERNKVTRPGPTVALVGASRMQAGFAMGEFRKRWPAYRIIQLAVAGRKPMPTFRDLAVDEDFRGIVIMAFRSDDLFDMGGGQQAYVDYFHRNFTLNDRINRELRTLLESHLVTRNPSVSLRRTIKAIVEQGRLPYPLIMFTLPDRSQYVDYSMADDLEERRAYQAFIAKEQYEQGREPIAQWREKAGELERMIEAIHGRGGHVVLVRYPTTEDAWRYDELRYPKAVYWDWLAAHTIATTIHFRDVPELANLDSPDTSHVDVKDVYWFTNRITDELVAAGVLPEPR
jgi:hypothetical protein